MLDVAEAIIAAALRREESRGAHQRLDFPARDDERYLAHSLVHRGEAGAHEVEYLPGDPHPMATRRTGLREVSDG